MSALKTVADYNRANRDAPTAAASLARGTGNLARAKSRRDSGVACLGTGPTGRFAGPKDRPDGKRKCANRGCGKVYAPADNGPTACRYHSGLPVFGGMEKRPSFVRPPPGGA